MKLMYLRMTLCLLVVCLMCAGGADAAGPALKWVDLATGNTLFTSDDIVRFDWDRQMFELTREKAMDLMGMDIGLHRAFSVRDADGDIYQGSFVSPLSSHSYGVPVIIAGPGSDPPPLYHIQSGYPESSGLSDIRFSTRLRAALRESGKLKPIDDVSRPKPIEKVNLGEWTDLGGGVKAWVDIIPETFHIDMPYRIHIRFWRDPEKAWDFDRVSVALRMLPVEDGTVPEERKSSGRSEQILSGKINDLLPEQPPFRTHVVKAKNMLLASPSPKVRLSLRFTMSKADGTLVRTQDTPEREMEITRLR